MSPQSLWAPSSFPWPAQVAKEAKGSQVIDGRRARLWFAIGEEGEFFAALTYDGGCRCLRVGPGVSFEAQIIGAQGSRAVRSAWKVIVEQHMAGHKMVRRFEEELDDMAGSGS